MPCYSFECNRCGKAFSRYFKTFGRHPYVKCACGGRAPRVFSAPMANTGAKGYPILSDVLGVGESQIQEARDHSVQIGVPTNFTPDGRAILESPKHRKEYAEALGYHERNSFGGRNDAQPGKERE